MYSYKQTIEKHLNITKLVYLYGLFGNKQFKRANIPDVMNFIRPKYHPQSFAPYFDTYGYYLSVVGLLRHDKRGIYHVSNHPLIYALINKEITRKRFIEILIKAKENYGSDYRYYIYETLECFTDKEKEILKHTKKPLKWLSSEVKITSKIILSDVKHPNCLKCNNDVCKKQYDYDNPDLRKCQSENGFI